MPPQADMKSPDAARLSSGAHGEWSEATKSIVPSPSPSQSFSRFSLSRIGGAHLNSVRPSPISSEEKTR